MRALTVLVQATIQYYFFVISDVRKYVSYNLAWQVHGTQIMKYKTSKIENMEIAAWK